MTAPTPGAGNRERAAEWPTIELREEAARHFAWAYGGEEYAESGQYWEHWLEVADDFMDRPFMREVVDAAEARGRAEMAGKVEALAAEWLRDGSAPAHAIELRALVADSAPAGEPA